MFDDNSEDSQQTSTNKEDKVSRAHINKFKEHLKNKEYKEALINIEIAIRYSNTDKQLLESTLLKIKLLNLMNDKKQLSYFIANQLNLLIRLMGNDKTIDLIYDNIGNSKDNYLINKIKNSSKNEYLWLKYINKQNKNFVYEYLYKNMISLLNKNKIKIHEIVDLILDNNDEFSKVKNVYLTLIDYNLQEKDFKYICSKILSMTIAENEKLKFISELYKRDVYNLDIIKAWSSFTEYDVEFYIKNNIDEIKNRYGSDILISQLDSMKFRNLLYQYINVNLEKFVKYKGSDNLFKKITKSSMNNIQKINILKDLYKFDVYNLGILDGIINIYKKEYALKECFEYLVELKNYLLVVDYDKSGSIYYRIGMISYEMKDYNESKNYLERAKNKTDNPDEEKDIINMLKKIDDEDKNPKPPEEGDNEEEDDNEEEQDEEDDNEEEDDDEEEDDGEGEKPKSLIEILKLKIKKVHNQINNLKPYIISSLKSVKDIILGLKSVKDISLTEWLALSAIIFIVGIGIGVGFNISNNNSVNNNTEKLVSNEKTTQKEDTVTQGELIDFINTFEKNYNKALDQGDISFIDEYITKDGSFREKQIERIKTWYDFGINLYVKEAQYSDFKKVDGKYRIGRTSISKIVQNGKYKYQKEYVDFYIVKENGKLLIDSSNNYKKLDGDYDYTE